MMSGNSRAQVLKASSIAGSTVNSRQGEELGHIRDLVIDVDRGQVAYAVLSFTAGPVDKLFAVPWKALQRNMRDETFELDIDKEQLERSPGFDKDDWPDLAELHWQEVVHRHYGTRPYWETPAHYTG